LSRALTFIISDYPTSIKRWSQTAQQSHLQDVPGQNTEKEPLRQRCAGFFGGFQGGMDVGRPLVRVGGFHEHDGRSLPDSCQNRSMEEAAFTVGRRRVFSRTVKIPEPPPSREWPQNHEPRPKHNPPLRRISVDT